MKTFIVFMAFVLIFVSFMCYFSDMSDYIRLQGRLKVLAEDCAAGAALLTDDDLYSRGYLVIDQTAAQELVQTMLEETCRSSVFFSGCTLTAELVIYDDEKGWFGCSRYGIEPGIPCAAATVTCSGRDLFRLPFITRTSCSRTATYSWHKREVMP